MPKTFARSSARPAASRPGGPHDGSRWEARPSGRTHRIGSPTISAPRKGRMNNMATIIAGTPNASIPSTRIVANRILSKLDHHAPLRGAGMLGFALRWVRPLARASHRLPSSVPLGHWNWLPSSLFSGHWNRLPSFVASGNGHRSYSFIRSRHDTAAAGGPGFHSIRSEPRSEPWRISLVWFGALLPPGPEGHVMVAGGKPAPAGAPTGFTAPPFPRPGRGA
ncbi:MAG: hypothetical protein QOF48_1544 [Verrucomicrobiota bacterium]|jgi:hypothetical protein